MGAEQSALQAEADAKTTASLSAHPRLEISRSSAPLSALPLRILCAGDSITWGTPAGGYRPLLVARLLAAGARPSMLGEWRHGTQHPADRNNVTACCGADIAAITRFAVPSVRRSMPDVVILHAGTNDLGPADVDVQSAGMRLAKLMDAIEEATPGVVLLVAEIGPIAFHEDVVRAYNELVRKAVAEGRERGRRVVGVYVGEGLVGEEMADLVHPNDLGFDKIAQRWFRALEYASAMGWLPPSET